MVLAGAGRCWQVLAELGASTADALDLFATLGQDALDVLLLVTEPAEVVGDQVWPVAAAAAHQHHAFLVAALANRPRVGALRAGRRRGRPFVRASEAQDHFGSRRQGGAGRQRRIGRQRRGCRVGAADPAGDILEHLLQRLVCAEAARDVGASGRWDVAQPASLNRAGGRQRLTSSRELSHRASHGTGPAHGSRGLPARRACIYSADFAPAFRKSCST